MRRARSAQFHFCYGLALVFAGSATAQTVPNLTGVQIRAAFIGHLLSDGAHFRWTYRPDGSIHGVSLGRPVSAHWRIEADRLCDDIDGPENCSKVARQGRSVTLTRDGSDEGLSAYLD